MKHTLQNLLTIFFIASGLLLISLDSHGQVINLFAGNDNAGFSGNNGLDTLAQLNGPTGIAFDDTGNLYIADELNNMIRKVSVTGIITTVAGVVGAGSFSGDGAAATAAHLNTPTGVAVDAAGNIYIADHLNNRVRKVTAGTGVITTIAGDGNAGFSGDLGQATAAELYNPFGVVVDTSGNIYISDYKNYCIRKITVGIIVTIAGTGNVQGFSGDNGPATAALLAGPEGLGVDASGNIYIADQGNNRIREVNASTGYITTIAGNGLFEQPQDGVPATSSELNTPTSVALDASGNFYITDDNNFRVRKVDASGIISTIAGDGDQGYTGDRGPATDAEISHTNGVCIDTGGNLYISDWGNNVVRKVNVCELVLNVTPSSAILCTGSNVPLIVSGGTTYTWSPATGLSATTGDSVIATPATNVTYTVTSTGSGTCSGKATVAVTVVASPNKPSVTQHGDTLFSSALHDNQWYLNGTALNDTSNYLVINGSGDYWVNTVNEANGCAASSDTTVISGINQLSAISNQLSIFPNPFNSDVVIKINSSVGNLSGWYMQVTDVLGRLMYTKPSLNYTNDIDLSDISNGIYFISVVNNMGKAVLPVVKQ